MKNVFSGKAVDFFFPRIAIKAALMTNFIIIIGQISVGHMKEVTHSDELTNNIMTCTACNNMFVSCWLSTHIWNR